MSVAARTDHQGENALQQLVRSRLEALGLSPEDLVVRLPYASADAARTNLRLCLERQVCARRLLVALSGILELPPAVLEEALAAAKVQRSAQERAQRRQAFVPHLRVLTHHRPECPTFVLGLTALGDALSHVRLPHDLAAWATEDREALLAATARGHYGRHGHGPAAKWCGGIAGYACHVADDTPPLFLDPEGRALDPDRAAGWFSVLPRFLSGE